MDNADEPASGPPAADPPATIVPAVTAVTIVQAVVTMGAVVPATVAPELARTLGVPAAYIGLQVSLAYAGAVAISFFTGKLVRRWGAVRTSQTACVLTAIAALLIAVPVLASLALGSLVMGVAYGLTNPAASHLLSRLKVGRHRTLVFSIKQAGQPLGGVAAGLIAPPIAVAFGWQASLVVAAGAAILLALLVTPLRRRHDDDRDPTLSLADNPLRDLMLVWSDAGLRSIAFAAFFFSSVQLAVTTFVVTMLVEEIRFGLIEAGIVVATLQVSGVCARVFWGWTTDRIRDGTLVLIGLGLAAAACGLATGGLAAGAPAIAAYALFIAFGATAVAWNGVFMAEVAGLAPAGLVSGITGACMVHTFMGVMVGPALFTVAYAGLGTYAATYQLFALGSLAGAFFAWRTRRRVR
jgi:predicted MFS family arabinose efflux permease